MASSASVASLAGADSAVPEEATAWVCSVGVSTVSSQLILPVFAPAPQAKGAPQPAFEGAWYAARTAIAARAPAIDSLPSFMTFLRSRGRPRTMFRVPRGTPPCRPLNHAARACQA